MYVSKLLCINLCMYVFYLTIYVVHFYNLTKVPKNIQTLLNTCSVFL